MLKKINILLLIAMFTISVNLNLVSANTADVTQPVHTYSSAKLTNYGYYGISGEFKIPTTMDAKWYKHTNSSGDIYADSDLFNFINFEQWIPVTSTTNPQSTEEWLEYGYHDGGWFGSTGVITNLNQITCYKGFFMASRVGGGSEVFYARKISPSYSPGSKYTLSIQESYTTGINWTNLWYAYFNSTPYAFNVECMTKSTRTLKQGYELCIETDTVNDPVVTATSIGKQKYLASDGIWRYPTSWGVANNGERYGITAAYNFISTYYPDRNYTSFSATN